MCGYDGKAGFEYNRQHFMQRKSNQSIARVVVRNEEINAQSHNNIQILLQSKITASFPPLKTSKADSVFTSVRIKTRAKYMYDHC